MRSNLAIFFFLTIVIMLPATHAQAAMIPVGEIGLGLDRAIPLPAAEIGAPLYDDVASDRAPAEGSQVVIGGPAVPNWPVSGGLAQGRLTQTWPLPSRSMLIDPRHQQLLLTESIVAQGMITPIPEPTSLILLGLGLTGAGVANKLRKRHA